MNTMGWGYCGRFILGWGCVCALLAGSSNRAFGDGVIGDLIVNVSGTSAGTNEVQVVDGGDGGTIDIKFGYVTDTGTGVDGVLLPELPYSVLNLTPGEYHYQEVVGFYGQPIINLIVSGDTKIYCQYTFQAMISLAEGVSGPITVEVYAGHPIASTHLIQYYGPLYVDTEPKHVVHALLGSSSDEATDGSTFIFHSSAEGDVVLTDLDADGDDGVNGGKGGQGGTITVMSNNGSLTSYYTFADGGKGSDSGDAEVLGGVGGAGGTIHFFAKNQNMAEPASIIPSRLSVNGDDGGNGAPGYTSETGSLDSPLDGYNGVPGSKGGNGGAGGHIILESYHLDLSNSRLDLQQV